VLLPQLVQQVFGYTSTLAGLVVSPGALVTIIIIPLVGLALKRIQARYLAMTGFLLMAVAFQYSSELTPDIDYDTLLLIRIAQMTGIGLMFAPLSVLATSTLRPDQNAAGASLFTMVRNIGGSIGISVATATVTNRSQSNRAYLAQHLSPNNQPYVELLAKTTARLQALGHAFGAARQLALGEINHLLSGQAAVMAYGDTFTYCGIIALLMVPIGLLAQPIKQKPGAVPGGH
jgi:DHA2 family multidrug resistance protein